jgi:hypothetical protein
MLHFLAAVGIFVGFMAAFIGPWLLLELGNRP